MRRVAHKYLGILLLLLLVLPLVLVSSPVKASSEVFYSSSYDGYLQIDDAVYNTAHDAASAEILETSLPYLRIGQIKSGELYDVFRSVIFIDTSGIPDTAEFDSATLGLYGKTDSSTTDFLIKVVPINSIVSPLILADYGALLSQVTSLGDDFNTEGFVTDGYNYIDLNDTGLAFINKQGVTGFGLRSGSAGGGDPGDTSYIASTDSDKVDVWASERGIGYAPKLTVVYHIPIIGAPDSTEISNVAVFTGYVASGDQLYIFTDKIIYPDSYMFEASDYYSVSLYDEEDDLVAQVPLAGFGFIPMSIYLSPDSALPTGGAYTIEILGNVDTGDTTVSHELSSGEWKGSIEESTEALDNWVMGRATQIGLYDQDDANYYKVDNGSRRVLNGDGSRLFLAGIPYLDSVVGEAFLLPGPSLFTPSEYGPLGSASNWGDGLLKDCMDNIFTNMGLPGSLMTGLIFLALAGVAVYVVYDATNNTYKGLLASIPVLLLATWFGAPSVLMLTIVAFVALYAGVELILSRS